MTVAPEDVPRAMAAAGLFLALLDAPPPARAAALAALLLLLAHPFPRLRKATAERLYVRLLVEEGDAQGTLEAVALLADTQWESEAAARAARTTLAAALLVEEPAEDAWGAAAGVGGGAAAGAREGGGGAGAPESFDSYGALAREAGY
jgi:hypothetical protein